MSSGDDWKIFKIQNGTDIVGMVTIDSELLHAAEDLALTPMITYDYTDKATGEVFPIFVNGFMLHPRTMTNIEPIKEIRK